MEKVVKSLLVEDNNRNEYVAPQIEVVEVMVENGFALSEGDVPDEW